MPRACLAGRRVAVPAERTWQQPRHLGSLTDVVCPDRGSVQPGAIPRALCLPSGQHPAITRSRAAWARYERSARRRRRQFGRRRGARVASCRNDGTCRRRTSVEVEATTLRCTARSRAQLSCPARTAGKRSQPANSTRHQRRHPGRSAGTWLLYDRVADDVRDKQWPLATLEAEVVWKVTKGEGQTVAVIHDGVEANHVDLKGNVVKGRDFIDGGPAVPEADDSHGTGLASIISGHGHGIDNSDGITELAPGAKILPFVTSGRARADSPSPFATRWIGEHRSSTSPSLEPNHLVLPSKMPSRMP